MLDRRTLWSAGLVGALIPTAGARAAQDGAEAAFDSAQIRRHLELLDRQAHLRSGSAGDFALAAAVEAELSALGFTITRQPVPVPTFEAEVCRLEVDGATMEVFAQRRVVATDPDGLRAPLRLWRDDSDTPNVAGAIALVQLPHARHSQLVTPQIRAPLEAALAGRPAAVALITNGPTGETLILNAPYAAPFASVPIVVLGPAPGRPAIAAAKAAGVGRLIVAGRSGEAETFNIVARRRAPGPLLVVSTPRTGWTPAVAERGPGFATFLALAHWAARALPNANLLFVCTTAHEFDNEGGLRFMKSELAPRPGEVALWAHLGAGFAGRAHHEIGGWSLLPLPTVDEQRFLVGSDPMVPLLREAFAGQPGLEAAYPASAGAAGELAEIIAQGYAPVFGLFGAHLRHHAMSDRIGMTDPEWIRRAALATRAVIARRFG